MILEKNLCIIVREYYLYICNYHYLFARVIPYLFIRTQIAVPFISLSA